MNIAERRSILIRQINNVTDEQTLEMLEETLGYYMHNQSKDITDGLDKDQLQELIKLSEEPAEKDTISEEEYRKIFARWGTK
jgi:hypothetical protein